MNQELLTKALQAVKEASTLNTPPGSIPMTELVLRVAIEACAEVAAAGRDRGDPDRDYSLACESIESDIRALLT